MYENLMEAAVTDENCKLALQAVKRNKGKAGIDRMTTKELEPHFEANWWILKDKLLKGTCVPSPLTTSADVRLYLSGDNDTMLLRPRASEWRYAS